MTHSFHVYYSFGNILNQGAFDNSIDFNDPGRTDNLNLKAEIAYRLYNGAGIKQKLRLRKQEQIYSGQILSQFISALDLR